MFQFLLRAVLSNLTHRRVDTMLIILIKSIILQKYIKKFSNELDESTICNSNTRT